ncbi:MAG: Gfo/Idh/MocA family oxidoreductase [Saprospiraceae bacterium]|nr:Gfo/Idh/MocA family oxidoreductase [Saprospiraceae bacterium]
MNKLKLGIVGCGFWSHYQTAAWKELSDQVEIVALCDRQLSKAKAQAEKFSINRIYNDAGELLKNEQIDFVDIITDVDSHVPLVKLFADHHKQIICQKPMAPSFAQALELVEYCDRKGVDFYIHENFRWQKPIRVLRKMLKEGLIGTPFKANIKFCSSFPVFDNQPFLAELDQFILTDVGTHILDVARFLFGEVDTLFCQTHRINPKINGEDVANVFMTHGTGVHCYAELSYASILEDEAFPQTYVLVEGEKGSLHLKKDYQIVYTSKESCEVIDASPPVFAWSLADYALIHTSIFECNRNILSDLCGEGRAETTAEDNLKTLKLVFEAYRSAKDNLIIHPLNS